MENVSEESVQAKRYMNNPDHIPAVGDIVRSPDEKHNMTVSVLGDCLSMFNNCTFEDKFHLTNPETLELVEP